MYQFVGPLCVIGVRFDGVLSPTHVVIGMISHPMPSIYNALVQFGIAFNVLANHKEGGTSPKLSQRFENERGGFGYWAIVESEVNGTVVLIHTPQGMRIKPT